MPPRFPVRLFVGLALALPVSGQTAAPAGSPASAAPTEKTGIKHVPSPTTLFTRIRGVFDVELPRLDPPGTFSLHVNPRFGDLLHRTYLRVPVGVTWAVDDRLGFNVEASAYGTHGLKGGETNHVYGIGQLHGGAKYLFPHWPRAGYKTSLGFNLDYPIGSPPADLTDGRNHYIPYAVVERRLPDHPKLTLFGGLSADFVTDSSVRGRVGANSPRSDSLSLTAGGIYDLGQVKWTLESTYTTTALIGHDARNIFTVRPSLLWFVPRQITLNSKTQWIVGLGARATWGPDGFEFSTGTRVRAEITFRQVWGKIRGAFEAQDR
jgi:hypothetical protein